MFQGFQKQYPPESVKTEITLSQFLSIQEKGVLAWEFVPDLEAGCTSVNTKTEVTFLEVKLYDFPESTVCAIGLATKPYPWFRLPGWNKRSVAYVSNGTRRISQPLSAKPFGTAMKEGDVIGCGYRPRYGTVFFTHNGKKIDDAVMGHKSDLFPTIGAMGPCSLHVNLGQMGFVLIEANIKKWGLAPINVTVAPPPQYGIEGQSILLMEGAGPRRPLERFSKKNNLSLTAEDLERRPEYESSSILHGKDLESLRDRGMNISLHTIPSCDPLQPPAYSESKLSDDEMEDGDYRSEDQHSSDEGEEGDEERSLIRD